MSEHADPGIAEKPSSGFLESLRGGDGRTAAAKKDDEWAEADALLLGQPTVLGEPGGR